MAAVNGTWGQMGIRGESRAQLTTDTLGRGRMMMSMVMMMMGMKMMSKVMMMNV